MKWPSWWQGGFRCWPRWSGRRTRSWRRRRRGGRRRRQTWGLPRTRSLPPLFSKRKLARNWTFFRKETGLSGLPSSRLDLLLDVDISCDLKWYFVFPPVSAPEWHLVKWPQWGKMSWQLPSHFTLVAIQVLVWRLLTKEERDCEGCSHPNYRPTETATIWRKKNSKTYRGTQHVEE